MRARFSISSLLLFLASAFVPAPLSAAFHLIKVTEVFAGTNATPNAHYVELQMYDFPGQNLVTGHSVIVYNAAGTEITRFTFSSDVLNGANQANILVATPEAQTLFGVTADLNMTAVIPAAGGKVCWDAFDCVAWGNYSGSSTGVGNPVNPSGGIPKGQAIHRRLDIAGSPTTLEEADDTNDSASNFFLGAPSPRNNAGATGSLAQRTFVSAASGSDANPCSRTAPCRQFAAAIARTSIGGEVIVLDSGGYGVVTINQAVSIISPPGVYAGVTAFSTDAVTVNTGGSDVVVLRGLTLNGLGGLVGIRYLAGFTLHVENVVVSGFNGSGIYTEGSGDFFVKDTAIRNNGESGITIHAASGSARVLIDHCRIERNLGTGMNIFRNTRAAIRDSLVARNSEGLFAAGVLDSYTAELVVENCALVHNLESGMIVGTGAGTAFGSISNSMIAENGSTGIAADSNGTIRVSKNTVTGNNVGLQQSGSGVLESAGNNTVRGNNFNTFGTITAFSPM